MEENKLDQATEDAIEEAVESNDNIKQLRDEFKKLKAENKAFKAQAMNSALESLGLEADKGIGKAVTKMYDGEMNGEAIAAFVQEEFGEVGAIDAKTEPDTADNVVQAQSRVEQLQKVGVDNKPLDMMGEFKQYVNSPNTTTKQSIAAKLAMMDQDKKQ